MSTIGLSAGFLSSFLASSTSFTPGFLNQEIVVGAQEKGQFDQALSQAGLAAEEVNEFYKDFKTDYSSAKTAGLAIGASLEELATNNKYDGLYNGASGVNLAYAQKRSKILQELITVMEMAKQSGNARLVHHFLERTKAAAKKSGYDVEDSLHWRELEAAARFACKDDSTSMGLINSKKESCYLDMMSSGASTCVFDAALQELKTRYAHISQVAPSSSSNYTKAVQEGASFPGKLAAGAADFGVQGTLHTAGCTTSWTTLVSLCKNGFRKGIGKGIASVVGFLVKPITTAAKALWAIPHPVAKFAACGLAAIGVIAGVAGVGGKVYGDCKNKAPWTESIRGFVTNFDYNWLWKGPAMLFVPDLGKFYGSSWYENTDQNALRDQLKEEVKAS